jgi:hypothetical protein
MELIARRRDGVMGREGVISGDDEMRGGEAEQLGVRWMGVEREVRGGYHQFGLRADGDSYKMAVMVSYHHRFHFTLSGYVKMQQ